MKPDQEHNDYIAGSFRDPSGFVYKRDNLLLRQVNASYREHFDRLIQSGLYEHLIDSGLLIPHKEVETALAATDEAYKIIQPELIQLISYPYEWCFRAYPKTLVEKRSIPGCRSEP